MGTVKTAGDVARMVKEPHLIEVAEALFQAMAYEKVMADIVKPKRQEVIDFYKFDVADEFEKRIAGGMKVVTDYEHLYLASKEDMRIFMAEMDKFYTEQGIKPKEEGCCPLLIAESLRSRAENAFVDALEPYMGVSQSRLLQGGMKTYRKYIGLNLQMFAPQVKNRFKIAA